jgi:predicted transposase YbfD/YdcC
MATPNIQQVIEEIFAPAEDWRVDRCKAHKLTDILFLSLSAMVSGADSFTEIEAFGHERKDWLMEYIDLANGIPSHDTIRRIFMEMKPEMFKACFDRWVKQVVNPVAGEVIALDGKQLRGMKSVSEGQYGFYLVGAWAHENGLCLSQQKVGDKSNEITAIPEILSSLDIEGRIITMDAMGTQKAIARQIKEQNGDYIMALKQNQEALYNEVVAFFEQEAKSDYTFVQTQEHQSWDKGHGRIEQRICRVAYDVQTLINANKWEGLASIIRINAQRDVQGTIQQQTRYYISSLDTSAQHLNQAIRSHWAIENNMHWVLDVIFKEDLSRVRTDHAPENLALMRKWTLNLIKANKGKYSVKAVRLKAGWNLKVLEQMIFGKIHNA